MNSLTHWIGEGEAYYQYSDEDAIPVSEEWESRKKSHISPRCRNVQKQKTAIITIVMILC